MATQSQEYDPAEIEPHWQQWWSDQQSFRAEDNDSRPKYWVQAMFPYPSGLGLHLGHAENYTGTDIIARFKRAQGFNVLHPMGWDAFGLPAEQYAIKTGNHPSRVVAENLKTFRAQSDRCGFGFDWEREINTTDPGYYRWTQHIFLQLFKAGLAYVEEKPVWWCDALKAVLANEEIVDGKSEVGGHPVERRNLRQVILRITAYAEDLLDGLKDVDWPDSTKRQQTAWIGRSTGAEVVFTIDGHGNDQLTVFTTRPDTLFGATYMVLAPEHPLVETITAPEFRERIAAYRKAAATKSDLDRAELAKGKTGVPTGAYAINPVNGVKIPIWVADYVLMSYGTGAIMEVPAHDERECEFAPACNLPIQRVIEPDHDSGNNGHGGDLPYTGDGRLVHSGDYTGKPVAEGKAAITTDLEKQGKGKTAINYKLRDWIFSRQRYWGEPIPLVWVTREAWEQAKAARGEVAAWLPEDAITTRIDGETRYALPVPDSQLPLHLPEVESYQPSGTGESPLAKQPDFVDIWFHLETGESRPASQGRPSGEGWVRARRETNTMPQWAGSCWYHLRYLDPRNTERLVDPDKDKYWGTVDLYMGGNEHAVLHLLYARFWQRVLHAAGVVADPEPYKKLFHQGLILAEDGSKMSKSRGTGVNPDDVVREHGADALRLYLMFLGPLEAKKPWNPNNIGGIVRFLRKLWREFIAEDGSVASKLSADARPDADLERLHHETIRKVGEDYEHLRFNTVVSQLMILLNGISKADTVPTAMAGDFLRMLAPLAPHIAEELWERLGNDPGIMRAGWPEADPEKLKKDTVRIVFQVNGKVRAQADLEAGLDKETLIALAKDDSKVRKFIEGKTIRREIVVPNKLVNLVV
ncbi:MAG: leucine--tRNA ligase [Opitutales bacterium]